MAETAFLPSRGPGCAAEGEPSNQVRTQQGHQCWDGKAQGTLCSWEAFLEKAGLNNGYAPVWQVKNAAGARPGDGKLREWGNSERPATAIW